jgi:hypothetical protein
MTTIDLFSFLSLYASILAAYCYVIIIIIIIIIITNHPCGT